MVQNSEGHPEPTPAPANALPTLDAFLVAADVLSARISEALSRVGLSYPKYEVLKVLSDFRSLPLGSLAGKVVCSPSNVTQVVDRLETEGLVRRVDDPHDRRVVRAEVTPQGAAKAEEGTTYLEAVRAQFAASFTAPEHAELVRLLTKVR